PVAQALSNPPCNYHRQPAFATMFAETERELKKLVGIRELGAYFATVMTTTGTGANEACLLALEGTGKGLILENGFFGAPAVDLATASSAKAIMAAPGLGIVITRKAAVEEITAARAKRGQTQPKGYYFDVFAEYEKQAKEAQPRFAQPVALHAALHAACVHLR